MELKHRCLLRNQIRLHVMAGQSEVRLMEIWASGCVFMCMWMYTCMCHLRMSIREMLWPFQIHYLKTRACWMYYGTDADYPSGTGAGLHTGVSVATGIVYWLLIIDWKRETKYFNIRNVLYLDICWYWVRFSFHMFWSYKPLNIWWLFWHWCVTLAAVQRGADYEDPPPPQHR